MEELSDFNKIECPFVRKRYHVTKGFKKHGNRLQLREPVVYLVTPEIREGYEWVFEAPDVRAVEKLDGTNVKVKVQDGRLVALMNRKNVLDPLSIMSKGQTGPIIEGVFQAISKGYLPDNQETVGEVIGPKLQGNPYELPGHHYYPFDRAFDFMHYKSFYKHERTFENFSAWFKDHLRSLYWMKIHNKGGWSNDAPFAEGVVFTQKDDQGRTRYAKLRRDMYPWYYEPYIEIGEEVGV